MPAFFTAPPDPVIVVPWEGGEVRIHADDDAVTEALWLPSRVVQRTRSGLLVVRDRATLAVLGHLLPSSSVLALAEHDGQVLIALDGGALGVLDPITLEFRETARVHGPLAYLGDLGGRAVALVRLGSSRTTQRWTLLGVLDGQSQEVRYRHGTHNHDFYDYAPLGRALGDSLLLSWDWGEFGGDSASLAPHGRSFQPVEAPAALGFSEVGDRTVGYGGLEHLTLEYAFIADARTGEVLFETSNYSAGGAPEATPDQPVRPITAIAQVPGGDLVYVLSYDRLFQTDPRFEEWRTLGRLEVSEHDGRALSVGGTPSVNTLHAEADGTLVAGSDADGFLVRSPDGSVRAISPAPRVGYSATQLFSGPGGLYAGARTGIARVGDPAWSPDWPEFEAGVYGAWWDVDPEGRLRITGTSGVDLVEVSVGGEVKRTPIPDTSLDDYDLGAVVRMGDRVLVGGSKLNRSWDGERWVSWPAAAWFTYYFQQPQPVPGSPDLILDLRSETLYRVPAEGGAWEKVQEDVSDALQSPRWGLVTVPRGSVAEDGCGRLWKIDHSVSITDEAGAHELPLPLGLRTWLAVTGLPDGVAIGGVDLLVELHRPC